LVAQSVCGLGLMGLDPYIVRGTFTRLDLR
jgi:hypothetical protein